MKVTWKDNEVELKYSFRSMMLFENVTGRSFSLKTTTDSIVYFYCVLIASSGLEDVDFDEFVDWLDENPQSLVDFSQWLTRSIKAQEDKMPASAKAAKTAKKGKTNENPKN